MCELPPGALRIFIIQQAGSLGRGRQQKNIIAEGFWVANDDNKLFVCFIALNVEFLYNTDLVLYWISV